MNIGGRKFKRGVIWNQKIASEHDIKLKPIYGFAPQFYNFCAFLTLIFWKPKPWQLLYHLGVVIPKELN